MLGPIHKLTLADVLREHRRSRPLQIASVCGARRLTFPELDTRANRLASALAARGVGAADGVLWLAQNSDRYLEVLFAAAKLGARFCPLNWRQTGEEMRFVLSDAKPAVVFWQDEEIGDRVRALRADAESAIPWIQVDSDGGADEYEAVVASGAPVDPERDVEEDAPLLQMYTAAFAGRPNGALLSHRAIVAQCLVLAFVDQKSEADCYLASGPLFHMGTFMLALSVFLVGGRLCFVRRVVPEEICEMIQRERCTGAYIVGPTVDQIAELNRDGRYDLSSLRGMRLHNRDFERMTSEGLSPWNKHPGGYGQTETHGMVTYNCFGIGSQGVSGRSSPLAQLRILDDEGRELPPGEIGEICVRGWTVMNGYFERGDENARRQRGGWHRTNDLGRREADGSVSFVGPKTRMIKSAAENIYPAEVERCLLAHPAVRECAVIGVPDPKWVQSVKAIVVLSPGASATADELIEHCRAHIASYKKPRSVEFADAIPRTGNAPDYDALDARYGGGGYPGGRTRSA
jgi:long-chain acyl-CoA synthetase